MKQILRPRSDFAQSERGISSGIFSIRSFGVEYIVTEAALASFVYTSSFLIAIKSETCKRLPTNLASPSAGVRVRVAVGIALHARINPPRKVCQRKVVKTNPKGVKTECVFADGPSILVSNFVASFIRAGDEVIVPLELEAADAGTQIYIRHSNPEERRRDVSQTEIGYATQPRKDKRNSLFVSAGVSGSRLGISTIHIR